VALADVDPAYSGGFAGADEVAEELEQLRERMTELQGRLYAEHEQALLIVLQAIDAGGKDGAIRRVFSGMNPQGCEVSSFKRPTEEELDHDFLWRYHQQVPGKGMVGVFNRSHYEDVLVVRVKKLVPKRVWRRRYGQINAWEELLAQSGVKVVKFYLHISKAEQKERLQKRLQDPQKRWKFDPLDLEERKRWDDYQAAFQDALSQCSTRHAPWYVVPANHKWFRDLVLARAIVATLEQMDPQYPEPAEGLDGLVIAD